MRTHSMDESAKNSHIGLCVLCGIPGAGKSTLAQQLKNRHNSFSVVIISYDDVMADTAFEGDSGHEYRDASCQSENQGGRDTSLWKQHRQHLLQCLESLLVALLTSSALKPPSGKTEETWNRFIQCLESQGLISAGDDCLSVNVKSSPVYFVLDDNFYYQSMRYEVFQLARKFSLGFCQVYLHCPIDCCLLRNNGRRNRVMDKTIILMDSKLERPNPEKNTWEKDSVYLDTSDGIKMDELLTRIATVMNRALENPVMPIEDDSEEKERDRYICAASVIHQADQNLRRLISETMQTVKGLVSAKDIKQIAQELQQTKSKALDQLRQTIASRTVHAAAMDRISGVQSSFRGEVDCILQQYLHKVRVDAFTAPSTVS